MEIIIKVCYNKSMIHYNIKEHYQEEFILIKKYFKLFKQYNEELHMLISEEIDDNNDIYFYAMIFYKDRTCEFEVDTLDELIYYFEEVRQCIQVD